MKFLGVSGRAFDRVIIQNLTGILTTSMRVFTKKPTKTSLIYQNGE
jgi:hypothetical protein